MLDHVGFEVTDFEASKVFYERALEPLGIGLLMGFDGAAGFGKETEHGPKPFFWIHVRGRPPLSGARRLRRSLDRGGQRLPRRRPRGRCHR